MSFLYLTFHLLLCRRELTVSVETTLFSLPVGVITRELISPELCFHSPLRCLYVAPDVWHWNCNTTCTCGYCILRSLSSTQEVPTELLEGCSVVQWIGCFHTLCLYIWKSVCERYKISFFCPQTTAVRALLCVWRRCTHTFSTVYWVRWVVIETAETLLTLIPSQKQNTNWPLNLRKSNTLNETDVNREKTWRSVCSSRDNVNSSAWWISVVMEGFLDTYEAKHLVQPQIIAEKQTSQDEFVFSPLRSF